MNQSGTYVLEPGVGLVRVSEAIPALARPVHWNKGNIPNYDPSARCTFESRQQKRQWLKRWKLREGGIIKGESRPAIPYRNRSKPSIAQQAEAARQRAWVQAQGGATGLLNRIAKKEGTFV